VQEADPHSTLHAVRAFLRWRAAQPALVEGDIHFLDAPEPILAFTRSQGARTVVAAFNLSATDVAWTLPQGERATGLAVPGMQPCQLQNGRVRLPAHGVFFATVD
jgi:alpha-glucosidase